MADVLQRLNELLAPLPPYAIAGGVLVFVFLILGLRSMLKKPPARLTAFSSSNGSVLVSRKALQDLIRQTCLRDPSVEAARPAVKISKSKINTRVDLRLATPKDLKETSERLQSRIAALLEKSLSFDQIGSIEIMVSSFGSSDVDAPNDVEPKESPSREAQSTLSENPKRET